MFCLGTRVRRFLWMMGPWWTTEETTQWTRPRRVLNCQAALPQLQKLIKVLLQSHSINTRTGHKLTCLSSIRGSNSVDPNPTRFRITRLNSNVEIERKLGTNTPTKKIERKSVPRFHHPILFPLDKDHRIESTNDLNSCLCLPRIKLIKYCHYKREISFKRFNRKISLIPEVPPE
ncbi:hypothetical protein SAY87_027366 [Trapa incisa]|uniref:Uncharacterized protein n=1 Tax=Trapa incisa TaxID=236973 RepID=A0AAN7JLX1_9MYRT|nr:hypothetical protein SAY87_027366 [Trapa incisa]